MPTPAFDHLGVLPPFLGEPTERHDRSPYRVSMDDLAARFGSSPERIAILRGLIELRTFLRGDLGLSEGLQWIDGSFVEDVERSEGRPPRDVDVLTIAAFPPISSLTATQKALLDPREAKRRFRCDAYLLNVSAVRNAAVLIERVTYWHGLFSHRRDGTWKGLLAVALDGDDDARALARLETA